MDMENKEFVSLLTASYSRINSFIYCMVPHSPDAEDIMQETTALMWEKFDQYKSGTNFVAWAMTIANFKIMSYRRDKARNRIRFDDHVMEMIETISKDKLSHDNTAEKIAILKDCIRKLPKKERQLIQSKYSGDYSNSKLAENLGISIATIYRRLSNIYSNLLRCISKNGIISEEL